MSRYLTLADDPIAGGTNFDELTDGGPAEWAPPTMAVPISAAQMDDGLTDLNRDNENRGRRARSAPVSFASAPSGTFTARAYPKLIRKLLPAALSGAVTTSGGTAGAAYASTMGPVQTGPLRALQATLVREAQIDRLAGAVVEELAFDFPADEEGSVEATLQGLYHDVDLTANVTGLPTPSYTGYDDSFMLRDIVAYQGAGAGVQIDCLGGFGFTWNNGLIDDFRSRFCAGKNIETTVIDGQRHKLWYPNEHKYGAQTVTGRLDFGSVQPDRDLRRILRHADKLVVELAAGPLATTPVVDEMLRLTFYKQAFTDGGAEPFQAEGDQVSSYTFTAYLDETTNKDVEATFLGTAAIL